MKKTLYIGTLLILLGGCWTTQDGSKVGVITKLAKQGAIIGTWEGQIVRGGFNAGSGVMGAPFDFTIESKDVVSALQTAMDNNQEVKIYYHREAVTFLRSESDDYFVDKVEVLSR